MSRDAEDEDTEDLTCLVYVNPEGITQKVLDDIKGKIVYGPDNNHSMNARFEECVHFEVALPYCDLLAMARANKCFDNECFYVLNQDAAKEGAVLCCEKWAFVDVKGMDFRYPSAATTCHFYMDPTVASAMAVNLSIAKMDFADFSHDFGHAHLKRGEVSKPFWVSRRWWKSLVRSPRIVADAVAHLKTAAQSALVQQWAS